MWDISSYSRTCLYIYNRFMAAAPLTKFSIKNILPVSEFHGLPKEVHYPGAVEAHFQRWKYDDYLQVVDFTCNNLYYRTYGLINDFRIKYDPDIFTECGLPVLAKVVIPKVVYHLSHVVKIGKMCVPPLFTGISRSFSYSYTLNEFLYDISELVPKCECIELHIDQFNYTIENYLSCLDCMQCLGKIKHHYEIKETILPELQLKLEKIFTGDEETKMLEKIKIYLVNLENTQQYLQCAQKAIEEPEQNLEECLTQQLQNLSNSYDRVKQEFSLLRPDQQLEKQRLNFAKTFLEKITETTDQKMVVLKKYHPCVPVKRCEPTLILNAIEFINFFEQKQYSEHAHVVRMINKINKYILSYDELGQHYWYIVPEWNDSQPKHDYDDAGFGQKVKKFGETKKYKYEQKFFCKIQSKKFKQDDRQHLKEMDFLNYECNEYFKYMTPEEMRVWESALWKKRYWKCTVKPVYIINTGGSDGSCTCQQICVQDRLIMALDSMYAHPSTYAECDPIFSDKQPFTYWKLDELMLDYDGSSKVIAIIDTGIDETHPAFVDYTTDPPKSRIVQIVDFRECACDEGCYIRDRSGHGTFCAGVACGKEFRVNTQKNRPFSIVTCKSGIAWQAKLVFCVVCLNTKPCDQTVKALEWIAQNYEEYKIDVVSYSLGHTVYSEARAKAITSLIAAGIIVVCSASNEGQRHQQSISYPARLGHVLSIGSHDVYGNPSDFSPVGQQLDFLGPGAKIAGPSLAYPGYKVASGTSYAAPAVAGLICLILECIADKDPHNAQKVKNHWVMKEILRSIATNPGLHLNNRGYGSLEPKKFFFDPEHFIKQALYYH